MTDRDILRIKLDLDEWLELLEEKGSKEPRTIWSDLTTRDVLDTANELLEELTGIANALGKNGEARRISDLFRTRLKEIEGKLK